MKLTEYIRMRLKESNDLIHFDVGLNKDMTVNDESLTRVKFTIARTWKPKV